MESMFTYLTKCYARIDDSDYKKKATCSPFSEALAGARAQCVNYASLILQGVFDPEFGSPKLPFSPILKPLLEQTLPAGFVIDLIKETASNWDDFKAIFGPLVQCLVMEARTSSIVDATYRPSLLALTDLCDIKAAGNNRPICQLLTEMVRWVVT